MSNPAPQAITEAEYLLTERESPYKREYVGGFVYPLHAQAEASGNHVLISMNIAGTLFQAAKRNGCRLYQSDMKLSVAAASAYFYPDVMLVRDPQRPDPYHETAPCLLVEVLSDSTADIDRRHKYSVYTTLSSLQSYLLVSQTERYIVEYRRQGEGWQLHEWRGEGVLNIPCLGVDLTLEDVYGGVL